MSTSSATFVACLRAAAEALSASSDELNRLDSYAGDGDLGITMSTAAETIRSELEGASESDVPTVLAQLGRALARTVPSTSGTLIAAGFLAAARAVSPGNTPLAMLSSAFAAATEGIQQRGQAALGDKTMVDALVPVCEELREAAVQGVSISEAMTAAAAAAAAAAERSAELQPKRGRASWMAARSEGHPDGGCRLVAIALTAAAAALGTASEDGDVNERPYPPKADRADAGGGPGLRG